MSSNDRELEFEDISVPVYEAAVPPGERDYVTLIEAAYDLTNDDRSWLLNLARAAYPILDRGLGVAAFFWDLSEDGKFRVGHPTFVGCSPKIHEGFRAAAARLTAAQARALYLEGRPCKLLDERAAAAHPRAHAAYRAHTRTAGFFGVSSADLTRTGCSLVAPLAEDTAGFPALGCALDQVARHIAAGMRLRRALRSHEFDGTSPSSDAVLDVKGKLLHAEPHVAGRRERGSFVDAARRLLESRKARCSRPEQAVELWRGLVLGRWSLVDHLDSDGKRFLVARKNAPSVREVAALGEEERRAAALFGLLGSVKLVAYELGLAPSTVSEELKSACRKLGCRDRSELAWLFRPDPAAESEHG